VKNILYVLLLSLLWTAGYAQSPSSIELTPFIRFDRYPKVDYQINSVRVNTLEIQGWSWGIKSLYKFRSEKKVQIKAGLGYYKYAFNKITQTNSSFGKSDRRVINYIGMGDVIFTTNKYWYNTAVVILGADRTAYSTKRTKFVYGAILQNYFTFSQYYRITDEYPTGPPNHKFTRNEKRNFGFSASATAAFTEKVGPVFLGPTLLIAIFDQWSQDVMFPQEDDSKHRGKWLNGAAIGLHIALPL